AMTGGDGELREAIGAPQFFRRRKGGGGIEIANFGGDFAIIRRGVEMRDLINAAFAGDEVLPEILSGMAERRHDAQTGNDDSAVGNVLSHKNQTGQRSRSCVAAPARNRCGYFCCVSSMYLMTSPTDWSFSASS